MEIKLLGVLATYFLVVLFEFFYTFQLGFFGIINERTSDLIIIITTIVFLATYILIWKYPKKQKNVGQNDKK